MIPDDFLSKYNKFSEKKESGEGENNLSPDSSYIDCTEVYKNLLNKFIDNASLNGTTIEYFRCPACDSIVLEFDNVCPECKYYNFSFVECRRTIGNSTINLTSDD